MENKNVLHRGYQRASQEISHRLNWGVLFLRDIMFRVLFTLILLLGTGCSQKSNQTWEDVKTATRYMQKGVDSMFGKDYKSQMLASNDEFHGPRNQDFVPLNSSDLSKGFRERSIPQPKEEPGKGNVPRLSQFRSAPEQLASLFRRIHFGTDQHTIKSKAEISALTKLASYLKRHPSLYLVVEGHCDERASASYNKTLGMRRANAVRAFLTKKGANSNRIYTISRGKEQPLALGHNKEDWRLNRRSEFRIYQK